jgi:cholesterol 25-hydroxylase
LYLQVSLQYLVSTTDWYCFAVIDLFFAEVPFFKKAKIQSDRKVTWELAKQSLTLQMWNQLLWIYPMALVQLLWVPPTPLPPVAPTVWEFTSQLTIFFLMFDFGYFVFHVVHHRVCQVRNDPRKCYFYHR